MSKMPLPDTQAKQSTGIYTRFHPQTSVMEAQWTRNTSRLSVEAGDLVTFRRHLNGPYGIVVEIVDLPESPHPSQPERRAAYVEWASEYTTSGNYQLSILEVVNEVS